MDTNKPVENKLPIVTIGIMAYNEEKHLAETLESVLQQDFTDYEIIIRDNASEDNTSAIAREFAEKYSKIRYIRHPENLGGSKSYSSLLNEARGKYFVLAGAHDLWSGNYLTVLVDALEKTPDAPLAYGRTVLIDEMGNPLNKQVGFIDTSGYNVVSRFNLMIWNNSTQDAVYGLFRLHNILKVVNRNYHNDPMVILLGAIALQGSFIVVPEATWYRRMNRKTETREERLSRYGNVIHPNSKLMILYHWRAPWAYFLTVCDAKVSFRDRVLLFLSIPSTFVLFGPLMFYDLVRPFILIFRFIKRLLIKTFLQMDLSAWVT